jgi:hypothetical protein
MLLLSMHALDSVVTEALFSDYYATVNPFFFLRDLFGAMVIVGVAMAVLRRYFLKHHALEPVPEITMPLSSWRLSCFPELDWKGSK